MYWAEWGGIGQANLDGSRARRCLELSTEIIDIALDVPEGRMYWADADGIHRADLEGTNIETLVTLSGQPKPRSLTLDLEGRTMYWTESRGVVHRADLDGSDAKPFFAGAEDPGGFALDKKGNKMYWTETGPERILRADLDGANVEALFTRVQRTPVGLSLDLVGSKMYWTDWATKMIHRANLDGSNVEALAEGLTAPVGIALDVPRGRMYWTNRDTSVIQRADLDGSNIEYLFTVEDLLLAPDHPDVHPRIGARSIGPGMGGLALDLAAGRMYWTGWRRVREGPSCDYCFGVTYSIRRASLDGTKVEVLRSNTVDAIQEYYSPRVTDGMALDPVGGKMYWALRHFVEHDTWTDEFDVQRVVLHRSNLDGSSIENLHIQMGSSDVIALDPVGSKLYWSDGSSIHRSGLDGHHQERLITGLGRLGSIALAVSRPVTTDSNFATESGLPAVSWLAPNYPNPFNAGTRLVYRLADPGPVRLEVYNVLGQRVRTLVEESQKAGSYQVHWDARDQGGSPAATGVYVTRLQYPGGEQTRRLLLLK